MSIIGRLDFLSFSFALALFYLVLITQLLRRVGQVSMAVM